jgi:acetoin utilization protein AcuB
MFVHRWMSLDVITTNPDVLASEALYTLEHRGIKRLPVMENDRVVGIVHRTELTRTLFINKSDPNVDSLMAKDVITIFPDAPLEEAALLMDEHNVAGLPVVDGHRLVGIITESDIFKAFVRVMGLLEGGQRITIRVKDRPGALIQALEPIRTREVNIISVASCKIPGAPPGTKEITLRLQTSELSVLVNDLLLHRIDVVDWR